MSGSISRASLNVAGRKTIAASLHGGEGRGENRGFAGRPAIIRGQKSSVNKLGSQVDGGLSREIGVLKNETINIVGSYDGNSDENPEIKLGSQLGSQDMNFERKIRTYVNDRSCQKPANFADSGIPGKL
ncbi:MAG: hypothetical protein LBU64_01905 [Planctomycetota bacterium]|jgi:hypothetical protein|nr:hypothetical protein [Planctomycetota bacterium]